MANSNQIELVVTVEVDKANQSIKSVNANLSGIEAAATKSARAASGGIDGMTASMVKGATAGNLLADAIKKAIEFAKEWTIEAAKEAAHAERAVAITRTLAKAHGDGAARRAESYRGDPRGGVRGGRRHHQRAEAHHRGHRSGQGHEPRQDRQGRRRRQHRRAGAPPRRSRSSCWRSRRASRAASGR